MNSKNKRFITGILGAVLGLLGYHAPAHSTAIWLVVETRDRTLTVMDDDRPVETFEHIAIGRNGADYEKRRGDRKTPLGVFEIGWINSESPFHVFFGFNYPTAEYAERVLQTGLIGWETYAQLEQAEMRHEVPPQNTELGGQIGIHGLGASDPTIHRHFDWTQGCIALTNEQIDRLRRWVKKGTMVVVR